MKHSVIYEIKDERNKLIKKIKVFPTSEAANSFFREIKRISVTKPILEERN